MGRPTTGIVLRGGPGDKELHREVAVGCTMFNRLAQKPDSRYIDSGQVDGHGRRIFGHSPPEGAAGGPTGAIR
jgi:hypothetical protein